METERVFATKTGEVCDITVPEAFASLDAAVATFRTAAYDFLTAWQHVCNATEEDPDHGYVQPVQDFAFHALFNMAFDDWVYTVQCLEKFPDGSYGFKD